jgi:signal transduction histidine kinase
VTRREDATGRNAYVAVLPLFSGTTPTGALAITGDERDPFTALDDDFLLALGRHVGAALERSDLLRRLAERTKELEVLSGSVLHQHEVERRKISLELHDETAQLFAAVKMQVALLQETASPDQRAKLERVLALIDAGIHSIRRISSDLRPPLLDDLGLLPALRALADEFSQRTGIAVAFDGPQVAVDLPEDAEVALFRALQEALSNVARHAGAARVEVTVAPTPDEVRMTVRDDGRGLSEEIVDGVPVNARLGLSGMRERIASTGGTVRLSSPRGGGAVVEIRVPVGVPTVA